VPLLTTEITPRAWPVRPGAGDAFRVK
jgi:hypothetical protein